MQLSRHQMACLQAMGIILFESNSKPQVPAYRWLDEVVTFADDIIQQIEPTESAEPSIDTVQKILFVPCTENLSEPALKKAIWQLIR